MFADHLLEMCIFIFLNERYYVFQIICRTEIVGEKWKEGPKLHMFTLDLRSNEEYVKISSFIEESRQRFRCINIHEDGPL